MVRNYLSLPKPVYVLCAGAFLNRAGTFIVPFLTIYMRDALHVGEAFAPIAMGIYGLGAVCGSIAGGHLADHVGRRAVMLFALLGSGSVLVVLSQISNPAAFLAGIFVFALIGETYRPAASALIADLTTSAERSYAYSLMYIAVNLGFAIGPAVGGIIAEYSFRWLFLGNAASSALFAVIIFMGIGETLRRRTPLFARAATEATPPEAVAAPGLAELAEPPTGQPATHLPQVSFGAALRHMLRDTTFLALCAAALLVAVVWMQSMSTFPLYLKSLGFGPAQYGHIIAVNGILIVICQLPLTHWMHGKPRGRLLPVAALLSALGFGLQAVAVTQWAFVGTVVIWTLGEMMQVPLLPPIVAELAPENMRARYMGVFGMCFSGANMIGAPLGGLVLTQAGPTVLWLGGAGLAILAAIIFAAIRNRLPKPHETPAIAGG